MGAKTCKPLQIFRVGTHTAVDGSTHEFSESMLRAAVAAYDPSCHEAPIVVGHPRNDDPAYGWIQSLQFRDGAIEALPHQVDTAFAELVNSGRYKKISASFYLPDAPANPKPGSLYLRHVGFLGAQPPSLKGLRSASFAASDEGVVSFGSWGEQQNASMWRRMREWLIGQFGMDAADKVVPDYEVRSLEEAARPSENSNPSYTEPTDVTPEQIAQRERELAAREQNLQQREAAFAERETVLTSKERDARNASDAAFIDGLIRQGQFVPAQRAGVLAFMSSLSETGVVEFGEGDAKQSKSPTQFLREYLAAQPKIVDFRERAPALEGERVNTDDANAIQKAAVEFAEAEAKAGRTVTTAQAVQHVLAKAG